MPNYVLQSPFDPRDYSVGQIAPGKILPPSVRLDFKFKKVLNQLFCGSCVGKAANAILSAIHQTDLSSLYIYSRCKELDGIPHLEGTYPRVAMKVLQKEGSCPEKMLPYEDLHVCLKPPVANEKQKKAAEQFQIESYARCFSLNDIKQAAANGQLVMGSILVTDNFIDYKEGVIGPPTGHNHGYHAVVFCGYDDVIGAVRGINSWGPGWGEQGYFWLDYKYFEVPTWYMEGWAVKTKEDDVLMDKKPNKFASRKFWMAVVAGLLVIANEGLGWNLPEETISSFILVILGWIGIEGINDAVYNYKH